MMEDLWKNIPEFPRFKALSLEDKPLFDRLFNIFPPSISEFTFTNLFIWRYAYQFKISRFRDHLCLLSDQGDHSTFFSPIGEGDMVECFKKMLEYLEEKGATPKIVRVPEDMISRIDWEAAGLVAEFDRSQSDYIYLVEDLIQLKGRKYHRKRNHIKQFQERYAYEYIPLTTEWISECLRLESEWCDLRHCEIVPGLLNESIAIKEALSHFGDLGVNPDPALKRGALGSPRIYSIHPRDKSRGFLRGGVKGCAILINGRVEAFSLGEPLNQDTVVIHIEKANAAFEGLYSLINQVFLENQWSGYTYVNREQDLGEEGLRKAKESYFPHHMVNKYSITLK